MRADDRTVCKVAQKRKECLGRAGTSWCAEMYTHVGSKLRKAHPILSLNKEMRFPRTLHKRKGPLCRGPSQFKVAGKGIASARCADGPLRRLRALRATLANAYAFTQLRALTGFDSMWGLHKRKGPLCRGPKQFKVAGKGIEPLTRGFSVLCSTN